MKSGREMVEEIFEQKRIRSELCAAKWHIGDKAVIEKYTPCDPSERSPDRYFVTFEQGEIVKINGGMILLEKEDGSRDWINAQALLSGPRTSPYDTTDWGPGYKYIYPEQRRKID